MNTQQILAAATVLAGAPAAASDWTLDPAHSQTMFRVKHLGFSHINGLLGTVSGTLHLDEQDVTRSTVNVSIDVTQIDTHMAKRDSDLKSALFFDVAQFPTATFVSTKVEKAGPSKLKVTGNLTLHGVTKSIVLDVDAPSAPVKDPFGNVKIAASATAKLDRTDYGLTWNKPLENAGLLIGNEVLVTLDVEGAAKK
jgi:polyisoprenoid-binding protein YceI